MNDTENEIKLKIQLIFQICEYLNKTKNRNYHCFVQFPNIAIFEYFILAFPINQIFQSTIPYLCF